MFAHRAVATARLAATKVYFHLLLLILGKLGYLGLVNVG
jgi:hypothetical protein